MYFGTLLLLEDILMDLLLYMTIFMKQDRKSLLMGLLERYLLIASVYGEVRSW